MLILNRPTSFLAHIISCWFHGSTIISAALNLVFWTFFLAKTCCIVCQSSCFFTVQQIWREKMSRKPHSIRLLRWSTIANQKTGKTIEKPLKELPWNQQLRWRSSGEIVKVTFHTMIYSILVVGPIREQKTCCSYLHVALQACVNGPCYLSVVD